MEKKATVLHVCRMYYPYHGGIERVVQNIAEGLQGKMNMEVLTCQEKGRESTENIHGIPVMRCKSLGMKFSLPMSPTFLRHFREMSKTADIVHLHLPFPLADLACLLSGYKGKVVLWWHSDVVRQKTLMIFYKPLMYWLLKRADAIAVATEGHIEGSSYLKPYRDKCFVIPFGVEPEMIERADLAMEEQAKVGNKEGFRYLFVGRLVYYKGCEVLLRAFAKLKEGTLIMVGEGPLLEELKVMALELGIADRVEFLGGVSSDRLNQEFAQCDVFVLPSIAKSEAFGIVQIEAMAYGKPVINTWLDSGVPYVSLDKQTGLTVQADDVDALAEAMLYLQEHEDVRLMYGQTAAERARTEFTMNHMMELTLEMYQEVLGRSDDETSI